MGQCNLVEAERLSAKQCGCQLALHGHHRAARSWRYQRWLSWQTAKSHVWPDLGGYKFNFNFFYLEFTYYLPTTVMTSSSWLIIPGWQEWWDHSACAGPKQRTREEFSEPRPTLHVLTWQSRTSLMFLGKTYDDFVMSRHAVIWL